MEEDTFDTELDLEGFETIERWRGWPELQADEVRVNSQTISFGTEIVDKYKSHILTDQIVFTMAYNRDKKAFLLKNHEVGRKDNLQNVFSLSAESKDGTVRMNIPTSVRKMGVSKGRYFASGQYPNVYILREGSTYASDGYPEGPQIDLLSLYHIEALPDVGDVVSWVSRPHNKAPLVATGILKEIHDKENVKLGKVKPLSKRYIEAASSNVVSIRLDNLIIRRKRNETI